MPGEVSLAVRRVRARGRRRGALLFLAGGPGQSATPFVDSLTGSRGGSSLIAPALRTRDLIVFDQRGTGDSGLLRCPLLELANTEDAGPEAADCARRLGARRSFYTTSDSIDDIEAVRRAVGVQRITLYGVSYGTKVALAYARRYPDHVERLLLDSTLDIDGPDPFYRDTIAAVPRVLRDLCHGRACRGVTPDAVGDLTSLVATMAHGPLLGYVVDRSGERRGARLGRFGLLSTIVSGDLVSLTLDPLLPGALRSARQGDTAPLLRLAHSARAAEGGPSNPHDFSTALYAATTCEESPLPWNPSSPPGTRIVQANASAAQAGDAAFAPFDAPTVAASDVVKLCSSWPVATRPRPVLAGPLPDVPTLLLEGQDDLRTPLEGARRVAAQLPHAQLLTVPGVGHDAGDGDPSACSSRAVLNFFAGRRAHPCARHRRLIPVLARAPRSLNEVAPAHGVPGDRGRTACAVMLGAGDALTQLIDPLFSQDPLLLLTGSQPLSTPGLRGGVATIAVQGKALVVHFRAFSYVPGVVVSGDLGGRSSLRISGFAASAGRLRLIDGNRFRGRLGGAGVRGRLATCAGAGNPLALLRTASKPAAAVASRLHRLRPQLAPRRRILPPAGAPPGRR